MFIATASTTVKFHEFPDGKQIYNYQPGTKVDGPIRSISWSKDGQWLALVPNSGCSEIISVKEKLRLIHTVQDIGEPSCVTFQNTTKKYLGLGSKNGQVFIYDIKARNTKKRFPRAASAITHVAFTSKDTHCVAGCSNGDVLLYSNTSNTLSCTFKVPKSSTVTDLRTHSHKRNLILGGSKEGTVVVWDSNVGKSKFCADAHKAPVTSVAFSPISVTLVITTGLDRQFCIYDIDSKERIACVPVENSCTAVDFKSDATYFALAFQNGRVSIYDSRNVTQPAHSFEAHKNSIKHLLFQMDRDPMSDSNSFCSVTDEAKCQPAKVEEKKPRTSELFAVAVQDMQSNSAADVTDKSGGGNASQSGRDSFMAALGFSNNTCDSPHANSQDHFMQVPERSTRPSLTCTPNLNKYGLGKSLMHESKNKLTTSTPMPRLDHLENVISPIVTSNPVISTVSTLTLEDIQNAVRNVVKEELKQFDFKEEVKFVLNDLKSELLFQAKLLVHDSRRMLLDLQMTMIREFMKIEDIIRDELLTEPLNINENYIIDENTQLKHKVMYLEQQLANMEARALARIKSPTNLNGMP